MSNIVDFLQARITEDESSVETLAEPVRSHLLATFAASRRVIAMAVNAGTSLPPDETVPDYDIALGDVLTLLALPYANHSDYWASFQPNGRADVEAGPNRPLAPQVLPGTVAQSDVEQREYLHVAIALAQAVLADNPATPEQWGHTSIGVIGVAWSNEMSTELILSRALLAMTRLAVTEAELIARKQGGGEPSADEVSTVLASVAGEPI